MSETCSCGAKIEDVQDVDLVREWRRDHRHELPPLRTSETGGTASTERAWRPMGFVVPEHTLGVAS